MMPHSIPLSRGKITFVSPEDYERVAQFKWSCTPNGYAVRNAKIEGSYKRVYLHRFLLDAQPGQTVDHADGDRLNNVRANLRLCNERQNAWNSRGLALTSRFKGVCWHAAAQTWIARIKANHRQIYIGLFDSEEDAARAYDAAALAYHGEFARLNFPSEVPSALEHAADTRRKPTKTSLYHGVSRSNDPRRWRQPWCACIRNGSKSVHLGRFATEREAADAYDAAAVRLRGARAKLNSAPTSQ